MLKSSIEALKTKKKDFVKMSDNKFSIRESISPDSLLTKKNNFGKTISNFKKNIALTVQNIINNKSSSKEPYNNSKLLPLINTSSNFYPRNKTLNKLKSIKFLFEDYNDRANKKTEIEEENKFKYSIILKNLESWDKDHCGDFGKKNNISLYKSLNDYYNQHNLIEDKINLKIVSNMMNTRQTYHNINDQGKNNKIFFEILTKRKKEMGSILNNNLYKTKVKFSQLFTPKHSKEFNEDLDIDEDLLNLIIEDELKSVFYNQVIREKIKYENQLHDELLKVNNIIYEKKNLKKEKMMKLKQVCTEKNNLKRKYIEECTRNRDLYWIKYDNYEHHYNKLITEKNTKITKEVNRIKEKNNNINISISQIVRNEESKGEFSSSLRENKEDEDKNNLNKSQIIEKEKIIMKAQSPIKRRRARFSTIDKNAILEIQKEIKEIEYEKKYTLINMNQEMNSKLQSIQDDYNQKYKEVKEEEKKLENEVKILKEELEYFKKVNEELIREHKLYFMAKLKKGFDCRKEGLSWIVCNLLELQVQLEYHHFPKFLTHEHIDYIKNYANLQLKQNELKIIINVLKKKQSTQKMNDAIKCMDVIDNILDYEYKNNNESMDMSGYNNFYLI